ncbi:MAG: acyl-CoA dehydrogenase family protein [Acidobacteria bacterium]|nr:acyl-CoA dehydrogenase family protein [Acidobacteriota bacterium]
MDLNLSPPEIQFRDELRAWLEQNLPRNWKQEHAALGAMEEKFAYLRRWQKKLYEGGWVGVAWPKDYGGRGASLIEQVILIEEMARASAPPVANVLGVGLVGPTLIAYGDDAQKKRFLAKILSGEEIWCQGFSEPNAGSDLAALGSEARRDGDHFILDGHKVWNSYGWAADWCAMLVRTDPQAPKHKGLTYLLVDMHSPGVRVRPLRQMTGESEFSELFFQNVRVPAENVLGRVNDGWNVAISTLMHERNTLGANLHIVFKRQFDRIVELARANGKAADPLVRQKLARCRADIEVFRLTQMRAITRVNQSGVPGPEGSILKIFWSEFNQRFQQVASEILGPYAQLTGECEHSPDEGQWAYGFLRARGNTIEAGTSEVQRNIVAQFVLGLPKSY